MTSQPDTSLVLPEEIGAAISLAKGTEALPLTAQPAWAEVPLADLEPKRFWETPQLPSTARLLTEGGDGRIISGPNGFNRYGCSPVPEPEMLTYGSSTASTISPASFAAAQLLRKRLKRAASHEDPWLTYERELNRIRRELVALCDVENLSGLEIIFGASGTDLHLFASQLMVDTAEAAPLIIRVEAAETGRGVPDALAGRHFGDRAALGDVVSPSAPVDCGQPLEILEVKCRAANGSVRPAAEVDAEVEQAVINAVALGRRILLTMVDVSKTGLLAPSPACVENLQARFPESIEVLVDACQFRLAPATLHAYLERDFLVAITGSKFITGPTFCGALLVPARAAWRLQKRTLPSALKSYSARADWPWAWPGRNALNRVANYGLLLRWEAALTEWRAFRRLSDEAIKDFLHAFAQAVTRRMAEAPEFQLLPAPALNRGAMGEAGSWDRLPTIFSFLLRRPSAVGEMTPLSQKEMTRVHELLRDDFRHFPGATPGSALSLRCQLGQAVPCGSRAGVPVSALRLCLSSRLIVDAVSPGGRGPRAVIAEALAVLDKAAILASLPLAIAPAA